jgi:hypothetical protein
VVDVRHRGPGCAARISLVVPGPGPYSVVANTSVTPVRQTGRYVLSLTQGLKPLLPDDPCTPAGSSAPATGGQGRRTIQVGQTVNGTLSTSDESYSDTTYYQRWYFTTQPNTAITIDLASDDFDPVLLLSGLDSTVVDVRHRGPGCAARIAMVFPGAGPYSVVANTSVTPVRQTGRYVLSLTQGLKPLLPDDSCTPAGSSAPAASTAGGGGGAHTEGTITVGQSVQGQLTSSDYLRSADTTYAQWWLLQGSAGQQVTIDPRQTVSTRSCSCSGPDSRMTESRTTIRAGTATRGSQ